MSVDSYWVCSPPGAVDIRSLDMVSVVVGVLVDAVLGGWVVVGVGVKVVGLGHELRDLK